MDSTRSWVILGALGAATMAQPYLGCLPDDPETETRFEDSGDALRDVGTEVVVPALDAFLTEMDGLRSAVAALTDDRGPSQTAFLSAMAAWQELEVMQLGPAGSSLDAVGGVDLRDEIYSWPTVNPCRVDQLTVDESYASETFRTDSLVNAYGLDALEYLLFGPEGENDCPAFVVPNQDGSWDGLGDEVVASRRQAYALVVVDGVIEVAEAIRTEWTTEGGYADNLANAGGAGSDFDNDTQALNAIFDAMFYLEKVTKEAKLATPAGLLSDECSTACETRLELTWSQSSTQAVVANLRGFRNLFTGGEGTGFDDILEDQGDGALAEQVIADTDAAIALGEATAELNGLLPDDPEPVIALHDAVKKVADELKGDLATLLALEIPSEAAGDND
ncbi:MAG: imelysin family protein [Myxococcota bacterium]